MNSKILCSIVIVMLIGCASKPKVRTVSDKQISRVQTTKTPTAETVKNTIPQTSAQPKKNETSVKNELPAKPQPKTEQLTATSKVTATSDSVFEYIARFKEVAIYNMKEYGIPASITLAQGVLESGAGKGRLSVEANNHFGIKCHKEWTGDTISHDDDALQECFRKYSDPSESYRDHSLFLTSRPRYAHLFKLEPNDYTGWASGLKNAGYATDPAYPSKLTGIIERYKLYEFDNEVIGKPTKKEEPKKEEQKKEEETTSSQFKIVETKPSVTTEEPKEKKKTEEVGEELKVEDLNDLTPEQLQAVTQPAQPAVSDDTSYIVQKGDTFYSLSKRFNKTIEELQKLNNKTDFSLSVGEKIIIK